MQDLTFARLDAGLSVSEAAKLCGRSINTWRRWEREGAPEWVYRILEMRAGYLDLFGWHGWRIVGGKLYDVQLRYGWTPEYIRAAWWNWQRLAFIDAERRSLSRATPKAEGMLSPCVSPEPLRRT